MSYAKVTHPYAVLPKTHFWKTAIADRGAENIEHLWQPKFAITRNSKIITLGSCFAQHISKALRQNGFDWIDSESAPMDLPSAKHAAHGYGVFSFRTGNIYTAALLKQWVYWATGVAEPSAEIYLGHGRYFDPFRPNIPPDGFATSEEVFQAKRLTLSAIAEAASKADLLIFTLGLTEAWLNRNGEIYQMCPGTVRGEFSAENHLFHNFDEQEVVRDISDAFDELRKLNPNLRFLLTVSPVPLTATASTQHILTANTYSKSVLRSAAGYLAQTRDDVDYFPSYELIATSPFKGVFFEQNMRSVSSDGVAFVMEQFFSAIGAATKPAVDANKPVGIRNKKNAELGNDICDDIILETWSNNHADESKAPPDILLIGDSHMGMVAKAFDEQGIRYAGGAIMHGSEWHANQFVLDQDLNFNALPEDAKARWDSAFSAIRPRHEGDTRGDLLVITNIGMHSNALLSPEVGLFGSRFVTSTPSGDSVTYDGLVSYLNFSRARHFALVQLLIKSGFRVVWVSDPPLHKGGLQAVQLAIEKIMGEKIASLGSSVFLAGEWVSGLGGFRSEFVSPDIDPSTGMPDMIHGSFEYYRQLARELSCRFPPSRV